MSGESWSPHTLTPSHTPQCPVQGEKAYYDNDNNAENSNNNIIIIVELARPGPSLHSLDSLTELAVMLNNFGDSR